MNTDKVYNNFFGLTEEQVKLMDELIEKRLKAFYYPGCHQASLEHFIDTGKVSGSFRTELHALLMEYRDGVVSQYSSTDRVKEVREMTLDERVELMCAGIRFYTKNSKEETERIFRRHLEEYAAQSLPTVQESTDRVKEEAERFFNLNYSGTETSDFLKPYIINTYIKAVESLPTVQVKSLKDAFYAGRAGSESKFLYESFEEYEKLKS